MRIASLASLIFPSRCANCGRLLSGEDKSLCADCESEITIFDTLFCGTCHARLPEFKKICHLDAPYILGSATSYDSEPAKKLVEELKFNYVKAAASVMARFMLEYIAKTGLDSFFLKNSPVIVPVPLSKRRLYERGFNQSELVAEALGKRLNLPLETNALVRIKHSDPQSRLERYAERNRNVAGAFLALKQLNNVLLIDDVTTSGATFKEAALAMKNHGAKKILAISFAKARSF